MFSVTWNSVNNKNLLPDLGPGQCGLDVVGDINFPGLFIAFDSSYVYFRLRLNCDPRKNNPPDILDEKVWGVIIKNAAFDPLFSARVNGKNNSQQVEVYVANSSDPFVSLQCDPVPIDYGPTGNVEIDPADSSFDSTPDFFLDFKVSLSCFPENFFKNDLVYCAFTSDDANNINKEIPPPYPRFNPDLCGGIILPPGEVTPPRGIKINKDNIISI